MRYSFGDAAAPSTRTTQYFEILGNRALYHDGWIASCFHGRVPWIRSAALPFGDGAEIWELYNVTDDFSQAIDVSAQFPDKLRELQEIFDREARRYDVYPLSDQTVLRALPHNRPSHLEGKTHFVLYRENVRMPELSSVNIKNTSFDLSAIICTAGPHDQGVIICQGGSMAGWSFYVKDGRLAYTYNYFGREITTVASDLPLPVGNVAVGLSFDYDGGGLGKGGLMHLLVEGVEVASGRVERTVPFVFSMSGETLDVGVDTCSPVGPYEPQFRFTGEIVKIVVDLSARARHRTTPAGARRAAPCGHLRTMTIAR